ncbi:hypothetical protein ACVWXQ_000100 [Bradyrhizobium sp. S3.14.4]
MSQKQDNNDYVIWDDELPGWAGGLKVMFLISAARIDVPSYVRTARDGPQLSAGAQRIDEPIARDVHATGVLYLQNVNSFDRSNVPRKTLLQ